MVLPVEPQFQRDDFSCGAVALSMVLAYDGRTVGKWIRQLASPLLGISAETLTAAAFAAYSGRIASGTFDTAALAHFTKQGRPVIALVTDPVGNGGHWLTVVGVSRGRVHFCCPTNGRGSQRIAEWERYWCLVDAVGNWRLDRFAVVTFPD